MELKANVKDVDGLLCILTDNINKDILDAAGKARGQLMVKLLLLKEGVTLNSLYLFLSNFS